MKHKHAELIKAWADGAEIEERCVHWAGPTSWYPFTGNWADDRFQYRIKSLEIPQYRKDMAQALKEGKIVQYLNHDDDWVKCIWSPKDFLNTDYVFSEKYRFRIKPEPNPDVVEFYIQTSTASRALLCGDIEWVDSKGKSARPQLKVIFDGETGALKSSEVLK